MSYIGDFRLGDTFDTKFTTTAATTGAPTTLAGTPVISAYVGNSVTQITAGITLTVDFDLLTGLNNVRVVASGANGYATASNYQLVITTGTVGGTSAVGYVICEFSIEARSALMPTTAARTLDVSAGGEAGMDWANVGTPGSTVSLSATTVATTTTATNVTTVNGLAANVITAASINAAAMNGKGDWNIGKTGYALSAAGIQAIWDALTTALTTVGSIGKLIVDNINATISSRSSHSAADVWASATRTLTAATNITSTGGTTVPQTGDSFARLGAPTGVSVSADIASIQADTDNIQTRIPAALVGGRIDANLGAISTSVTAADNLERSTLGIVTGTVGAASTTTSIVTSALSPAAAVIDQYKGRIVTFDSSTTTANLRGQSTDITSNTAAGVLTVTALTTAPVSGDTFTIT